MILIENISNKVILSAGVIELFADYAKIGNKKYYAGISSETHTLINDKTIPYGQANWWKYENNEFSITNTGLVAKKDIKRNEIRTAFEAVEDDPVTVNAIEWNGGYDSALKLDGAKRMAELSGLSNVVFYDVNNVAHTLTIAEANPIITAVGSAYQTHFAHKQDLMIAIDNATTLEELDGIVW